ncbi:MAG TPA: asparagine synthase C-terminal domain-containing protein, partial [Methanomicrobiales archaeon]|nr:asparagine synthase C-terminal domain-containing protein [Methanomicrobiales archaeon]
MSQASRQLRTLLEDAVERRMMADVPLGVFLSGGLDSSAIAALLAERTDELETFAVSFPDNTFDESDEARYVADHLGANHHEVTVDISVIDRLNDLVTHLGEPPSHPQFLPIYEVSRLARQNGVKVALAGEGADELFGGYSRYQLVHRARRLVGTLPTMVYDAMERFAAVTPVGQDYCQYVAGLKDDETTLLEHNCGFDFDGLAPEALLTTSPGDDASGLTAEVRDAIASSATDDTAQYMTTFDIKHLLPDFVLMKTDATSMAASREVRVPFMDHHLVEFAHRLPTDYRITPDNEKAVLKRAVADIVPDRVLERNKHGMGIPVGSWFRRDHDAIADLLTEERLATTPYVDSTRIRTLWDDHRARRGDHGRTLWTVL